MGGVASETGDPEPDYHNFSQSSSAHRLPTLNGAQALFDVIEKHRPISTNLVALDRVICGSNVAASPEDRGVIRGAVTEIYGAPGSGKTHFAIQLVANVLRTQGDASVVWIDTSSELPLTRLQTFLKAPLPRSATNRQDADTQSNNNANEAQDLSVNERFKYLYIKNFTHLLSVLLHPSDKVIPETTTLLVVDDFSGTVTSNLPQDERLIGTTKESRQSLSRDDIISRSIAGRRAAMISAVSAGLARLAATRNLAAVVLSKATSNRKTGVKTATLRSVLSSQQWNDNINTRILLYRMFWPKVDHSSLRKEDRWRHRKRETHALRVAEVERRGGQDVRAEGIKFVILNSRLQAVDRPKPISITLTTTTLPSSPPLPGEDNDEAMGQLGLEDSAADVDQSVRMPEDVPDPSSPLPPPSTATPTAFSQPAKRKLAEIADSEDEDDLELDIGSNHRSSSPPQRAGNAGFLLSSQLSRVNNDEPNGTNIDTHPIKAKSVLVTDLVDDEAHEIGNEDDNSTSNDDMLLQD